MPVHDIDNVIRTWTAQFRELAQMPQINHVQIFENRGSMMGASNPHPHCQIWATLFDSGHAQQRNWPARPVTLGYITTVYCVITSTWKTASRFASSARTPASLPWCPSGRSGRSKFWFAAGAIWERSLTSPKNEAALLAELLQRVTSTYDKVFDVPFPYSMGFHQSPTDGDAHPEWHFHAHFYPPLLRSATIRNSWWDLKCWACPSATSLLRAQRRI